MSAAPPPLTVGSLYYEIVEARLKEGLHFRGGGQTLRFGDSPQVTPAPAQHLPSLLPPEALLWRNPHMVRVNEGCRGC